MLKQTVKRFLPKTWLNAWAFHNFTCRLSAMDMSRMDPNDVPVIGFLRHNVREGWVCADIGANWGLYSYVLAELVPGGKVYAFELHPGNVRRMRSVLKKFGTRVSIVHAAVSDGEVPFVKVFPGRDSSDQEWNITGQGSKPAFKVQALSLNKFFKDHLRLDFIKIDVEGAGKSVIEGAKEVILRMRPVVFFEMHNDDEWGMVEFFLMNNYAIYDTRGQEVRDLGKREYHSLLIPKEKLPAIGW